MYTTDANTVEDLERRLGDPWDSANPVGFAAVLGADERCEMLSEGERILDAFGLNAEFVPEKYGGRLSRADRMIEILRSVYRYDPCLGLGHGVSSLIAAVNIWVAGTETQRCRAADLLLGNRKIACSYYELEHGNDLSRVGFDARPQGSGLLLNGSKQVNSNVERADALVIFARTAPEAGSRSHSQIFVDKALTPPECISYLPRFMSVGMRGVQLGGIKFHNCPVDLESVLGVPGQGLETAIKSFHLTRTALPGMFIGILDTGLRTTMRYALGRILYGRAVAGLPHVRSVLVNAFVDLLICDCFCTVVARAIHLLPRETSVYSPAVKYLVPKILIDAMDRLSSIMGAQFYLRFGAHAIFQKLVRDLKPSGFGHVSRVACQMTILPQLPRLARQSWFSNHVAPRELFQLDGDLPPLSFDCLDIHAGGQDPLAGSLLAALDDMVQEGSSECLQIRRLAEGHIAELRELKRECAALSPQELTVMAEQHTYDLTGRYANLLAASACLCLWWQNRGHRDPFLQDPLWIHAVLLRLGTGSKAPGLLPEKIEAALFAHLLERYQNGNTLDLANRPMPGWTVPLFRSELKDPPLKERNSNANV